MSVANPAIGVGDIKSDEKGSGARFNTGKPAMELIPVWIVAYNESIFYRIRGAKSIEMSETLNVLQALGEWQKGTCSISDVIQNFSTSVWEDCANVFSYGAKKYAEWNWIKGMKWSIPVACIVRHSLAILRGETVDPESGLPHRGHIACNLVMLAQFEQTYPEGNDLPTKWLTKVDHT